MLDRFKRANVKVRRRDGKWGIRLAVGVQSFWLDYYASWQEARWMARMLKQALHNSGAMVNEYVNVPKKGTNVRKKSTSLAA
jgi:hypothetical protein